MPRMSGAKIISFQWESKVHGILVCVFHLCTNALPQVRAHQQTDIPNWEAIRLRFSVSNREIPRLEIGIFLFQIPRR